MNEESDFAFQVISLNFAIIIEGMDGSNRIGKPYRSTLILEHLMKVQITNLTKQHDTQQTNYSALVTNCNWNT